MCKNVPPENNGGRWVRRLNPVNTVLHYIGRCASLFSRQSILQKSVIVGVRVFSMEFEKKRASKQFSIVVNFRQIFQEIIFLDLRMAGFIISQKTNADQDTNMLLEQQPAIEKEEESNQKQFEKKT